jgi:urease accessory protein UreE
MQKVVWVLRMLQCVCWFERCEHHEDQRLQASRYKEMAIVDGRVLHVAKAAYSYHGNHHMQPRVTPGHVSPCYRHPVHEYM